MHIFFNLNRLVKYSVCTHYTQHFTPTSGITHIGIRQGKEAHACESGQVPILLSCCLVCPGPLSHPRPDTNLGFMDWQTNTARLFCICTPLLVQGICAVLWFTSPYSRSIFYFIMRLEKSCMGA